MRNRVDKHGMLAYSWVYSAATVAAFAFLIVDLFDDGAIWNYAVVVCIIIAIVVRPEGGDGAPQQRRTTGVPRHAAERRTAGRGLAGFEGRSGHLRSEADAPLRLASG